jgi:hypothetical protein
MGNRAMQRLLAGEPRASADAPRPSSFAAPATSAAVGQSAEAYEREADRLAADAIRSPTPKSGPVCACGGVCSDCKRRDAASQGALTSAAHTVGAPSTSGLPGNVGSTLASAGQPLDAATRAYFEPRFGHDFSDVRVHTDAAAQRSALQLNAHAYSLGERIVFGAQRFAPHSMEGKALLAHELAHVVQHRSGAPVSVRRNAPKAQCSGVRISLPNLIVFEGNQGTVAGTVKTSLPASSTPYTIAYNPGEGQFVVSPGENVVLLEVSLNNKTQKEISLYMAYRDSLAGRAAGLEVLPSTAVATGGMDPRHARGYAGEQGMGFGYSSEKGWVFIEGPSGSGGHGITQPGFDGVAFNAGADELHVIDNKSLKASTSYSASALTRNLAKNLADTIVKVEGMTDMPNQPRILQLLKQMQTAIGSGNKIPNNTKLIITGESGQVTGVGSRLQGLGVEFRLPGTTDPVPLPAVPEPPPAVGAAPKPATSPPRTVGPEPIAPIEGVPEPPMARPRGGGSGIAGGLLGFFGPIAAGLIHQHAVKERIEKQANQDGYVPYGAPSGNGLLYDLGSWLIDPFNDADKSVGIDKRFNFPVWLQNVRNVAGAKKPGETLSMQWDIGKCTYDFMGRQEVESRTIVYKKREDGSWVVQSGNTAGVPDLNGIVSGKISDSQIQAQLSANDCGA